jgi:hypothetical protein
MQKSKRTIEDDSRPTELEIITEDKNKNAAFFKQRKTPATTPAKDKTPSKTPTKDKTPVKSQVHETPEVAMESAEPEPKETDEPMEESKA